MIKILQSKNSERNLKQKNISGKCKLCSDELKKQTCLNPDNPYNPHNPYNPSNPHNPHNPQNYQKWETVLQKDDVHIYLLILLSSDWSSYKSI